MKKIITILTMALLVFCGTSYADNNSKGKNGQKKQVLQLLKKINRTQNALAKKFNRLSPEAKQEVIAKTTEFANSDDDNLNDFLEGALNLNKCSSDSDDDGLDDSDEFGEGDDPLDDDSDDDGFEDGLEFEVHGYIESTNSNSITLASENYLINQNTEFLDDDNNPISFDEFEVGECVELEGQIEGSDKVLEKVKEDDDC